MILDDLLANTPPVTRVMICASGLLAVLCSLEVLSPLSLCLNWELVRQQRQWWRLVSCFFFYGEFSIHFVWNMYIYIQYCSSLEELAFRNKTADFVWMLISCGFLLLGLSYCFVASAFLSSALMDVMIYLWSKKNPHAMVHVLFLTVPAAYLPFTLTGLSLLMGGQISDHLMGIAVGHIFFFFNEIYPLMPTSGGLKLFRTPRPLKLLFRQNID